MIITNNMEHVIYYGKTIILPGSNVIQEDAIDLNHPIIKAQIENGSLAVEKDVTEDVAAKAIAQANSQKVVEAIVKEAPKGSKKVRDKASAKKAELDNFDAKVQAEIDAARKKKEADED